MNFCLETLGAALGCLLLQMWGVSSELGAGVGGHSPHYLLQETIRLERDLDGPRPGVAGQVGEMSHSTVLAHVVRPRGATVWEPGAECGGSLCPSSPPGPGGVQLVEAVAHLCEPPAGGSQGSMEPIPLPRGLSVQGL